MEAQDDWIETYLAYTAGTPTASLFRLWAAIGAVAGALERRVFIDTGHAPLYPHLFILLVAPPAIGKSVAIDPISNLWRATKELEVAPDNVTKASFVDSLAKAQRTKMFPNCNPPLFEYHTMLCCASELGVFMSAHDLEFLSFINKIFDCPPSYVEERRTLNKTIDISNPQINLLLGTQPSFLASMMPEEAWSMGFTSRLICVFASEGEKIQLFKKKSTDNKHVMGTLIRRMTQWTNLIGEAILTDDAKELVNAWYQEGCPPVPESPKLEHYRGRRFLYLLKLSLVSAVSRTDGTAIEKQDVERALHWLLDAEKTLPEMFNQMVGKSDTTTITELEHFIRREMLKTRQPVPASSVYSFLSRQVPSEKIDKILSVAKQSGAVTQPLGSEGYTVKLNR